MEVAELKRTALSGVHEALGAKMVPFAGYYMPLQYSGLLDEHLAVRNTVGLFDVAHMGEFILKGPGALELIQKISSNDASVLFNGKVQYSCMPNNKGGIIDDLLVYKIDNQTYMLVVNASNIDKDLNWIKSHNDFDVEIKDISGQTCLLALQGPLAKKVLSKLTNLPVEQMEYYTHTKGVVNGIDNVLVSATGYTGAGGFELYFDNKDAVKMWNAILEVGKEHGIKPAGLASRDTLRLEMGFCLYGNDINDETSPLEAGLGWITKFNKDFISKEYLLNQKEQGLQKKLVGFEMIDKGIPRKDYEICTIDGDAIGKVTSGTMSPTMKKGIGLGYVTWDYRKPETDIYIKIRGKLVRARIQKLPLLRV